MRRAIIIGLAFIAAPAAQAAERTVSNSQSFALSDSIVRNQDVLFSDTYLTNVFDNIRRYRGENAQDVSTALSFGAFDSRLGTLTKATLSFASTAIADMGVSQVILDPATASIFYLNPIFGAQISGHGVDRGYSDSDERLICLVGGRDAVCLTQLLDQSGTLNFTYDLDLAAATGGYSFDLSQRVGFSWDASIVGGPIATALVAGEWAGQASLTYTYIERAAVPEPTSWALMIVGMGAAGAALRRRRPAASMVQAVK